MVIHFTELTFTTAQLIANKIRNTNSSQSCKMNYQWHHRNSEKKNICIYIRPEIWAEKPYSNILLHGKWNASDDHFVQGLLFFLCARMVCGWVHKAPVKNQMRMKKTNQQANKWNKEKRTPLNVSKQGIQYNHTCHFFKFN